MTCREFEKKIVSYINFSISQADYHDFKQHMETCAACHDELEIEFLLNVGLQSLEKGDNLVLDEELKRHSLLLEQKFKREKTIRIFKRLLFFLLKVIIFFIILCILQMFISITSV